MSDFASKNLERLIQEHAIYKKFFTVMMERPKNNPALSQHYWKARAFEVIERLQMLDQNIPYYDPAWTDADNELFTPDIKSLQAEHDKLISLYRPSPVQLENSKASWCEFLRHHSCVSKLYNPKLFFSFSCKPVFLNYFISLKIQIGQRRKSPTAVRPNPLSISPAILAKIQKQDAERGLNVPPHTPTDAPK